MIELRAKVPDTTPEAEDMKETTERLSRFIVGLVRTPWWSHRTTELRSEKELTRRLA